MAALKKSAPHTVTTSHATIARLLLSACLGFGMAAHAATANFPAPVVTEARQHAIAEVKDEATRQALNEMLFILHQIQRSHTVLREPPAQTVYVNSRLTVLRDYPDAERLADVYASGIIGVLDDRGDIGIQAPFALPYLSELSWKQIHFGNGHELPVDQPAGDGVQVSVQKQGMLVTIAQPENAIESSPDRIQGQVSITVPSAELKAGFSPADIGKKKVLGDYAFALREIKDNRIELSVEQAENGGGPRGLNSDTIVVEARDASGRLLFNHGRLWEPPEQLETGLKQIDSLIKQAAAGKLRVADTAELLDRAGFKKVNGYLQGRFAFRGTVASVEVTLLERGGATLTRNIDAPVMPLGYVVRGADLDPLKLAGSVYDHTAPNQPQEVDRQAVARSITAALIKSEDLPKIRFGYPDVLTDRFIPDATRFGLDGASTIRFLDDKGKPLEAREGDAYGRVQDGFVYEPQRFSSPPARAQGELEVTRMKAVKRHSIKLDAPPPGITIRGNLLMVDRTKSPFGEQRLVWIAKDKTGKRLRMAGGLGLLSEDDQVTMAYYFLGDISELEAIEGGETETVPVSFDVELSPQKKL